MFVEGNQQAAMQAFMSGQIKVEGDMTKLMAMQSQAGDPAQAAELQQKLQAITAAD
jgi:putative sterol carrier protein